MRKKIGQRNIIKSYKELNKWWMYKHNCRTSLGWQKKPISKSQKLRQQYCKPVTTIKHRQQETFLVSLKTDKTLSKVI